MKKTLGHVEEDRLRIQATLDAEKTQAERNRLGQFATPTALAEDILRYAARLHASEERVRFLDPAFGTGSFYSALLRVFPKKQIQEALGFEIDLHYGGPAEDLWKQSGLSFKLADFTNESPSARFNLVICNPPYVRHHHLENGNKVRLRDRTLAESGMKLSGLAGLYCHFLGLSHGWMAENGIAGWLIPSEFMDVNYGRAVKKYLLEKVTLLHVHRFNPNDVQFADALVSSAVVWFRNSPPPADHKVLFTLGGTLSHPAKALSVPVDALSREAKWTRFPRASIRNAATHPTIADFFRIKRGIATGDNGYFILDRETIVERNLPLEVFRPMLPSPRYLREDEIRSDAEGYPILDHRLFLLDTNLGEDQIRKRYPALSAYLEEGKARGLHERYLCSHRSPWYAQENRPAPPIVCTYLGRGDTKRRSPFRFILNKSRATIANVYLAMYPVGALADHLKRHPGLIRRVWEALNALTPEQLLGEGRVYGGGLHKLEPKELANVDASSIAALIPGWKKPAPHPQLAMFGESPAMAR